MFPDGTVDGSVSRVYKEVFYHLSAYFRMIVLYIYRGDTNIVSSYVGYQKMFTNIQAYILLDLYNFKHKKKKLPLRYFIRWWFLIYTLLKCIKYSFTWNKYQPLLFTLKYQGFFCSHHFSDFLMSRLILIGRNFMGL